MPKNLRRDIESACGHALETLGFQFPRRGTRILRFDDDFYGWLGLNIVGRGEALRVDPVIGVHCVPVTRMFYELDFHRKPRPAYRLGETATVALPLATLAVTAPPFVFHVAEPLTEEAARLATAVEQHGLPWMRAHANLDTLLASMREREGLLNGYPDRVAITLLLLDRIDELEYYLDRKREEFSRQPNWGPVQDAWTQFSAALRGRLPAGGGRR